MAESAESSEDQGRAYPAGSACPECRYDLGGSAVARCSECGRAVGAGDVRAFWARVEMRRNWAVIAGRQLAFALPVGGSMLLGLAGGIMAMYGASRIGVSPFRPGRR